MKNESGKKHRRSIRLPGYDYSRAGAYFVTICTQNRECLFGEIVNGHMRLNPAGQMIQAVWDGLPNRFHCIELHAFTVMPNHIHGIIGISGRRGDPRDRPGYYCIRPNGNSPDPGGQSNHPRGTLPETLGRVVQAFKSITTCEYIDGVKQSGWPSSPGKLWQRNYWEHIIRNESEMVRICQYICNNPVQWELDTLNAGRGDQSICTVSEPVAGYAQEVWMV